MSSPTAEALMGSVCNFDNCILYSINWCPMIISASPETWGHTWLWCWKGVSGDFPTHSTSCGQLLATKCHQFVWTIASTWRDCWFYLRCSPGSPNKDATGVPPVFAVVSKGGPAAAGKRAPASPATGKSPQIAQEVKKPRVVVSLAHRFDEVADQPDEPMEASWPILDGNWTCAVHQSTIL